MRQVHGLIKVIRRSEALEMYDSMLSYRMASTVKDLPSLEEFLALKLNEPHKADQGTPDNFDENTDTFLKDHALKLLQERQSQSGRK